MGVGVRGALVAFSFKEKVVIPWRRIQLMHPLS